jgi:hypothetical protein
MRIVHERKETKHVPVVSVITRVARTKMGVQGLALKFGVELRESTTSFSHTPQQQLRYCHFVD